MHELFHRYFGMVGTSAWEGKDPFFIVAHGFTLKYGTGFAIVLETRADISSYHMQSRRIVVSRTVHLALKQP